MPVPAGPGVSTTTAADLVAETRWHLMSGHTESRAVLQASYTPGQGTLTFTTNPAPGVAIGHVLSVGMNVFYVIGYDQTSRTATVIGGQQGATDVAAAVGDQVIVSPRYTDFRILRALNSDLSDLSAPGNGLYQIKVLPIIYKGGIYEYDLASDVISVDSIHVDTPTVDRVTPLLSSFDVVRGADPSVFPSGVALRINQAGWDGRNLRVRYKAAFGTLTDLTTTVSSTGLPQTAEDLPPMGAAIRLASVREIQRNDPDAQGDTRRSTEVGAGALNAAPSGLIRERARRVMAESSRLLAQTPPRMIMPTAPLRGR